MRIRTLAAGLAMLGVGMLGPQAHAADVVTKTYVGVVGDLTLLCSPIEVGGACFDIEEGTFAITLHAEDAFNPEVGFRTDFVDAAGVRIGAITQVCTNVSLRVPEGAARVRVGMDGPIGGPAACDTSLPNGAGIIGEITYTPAQPQ